MEHKIVIAVDGFSSCGKSTMAKSLAKQIGYIYIDSGAMYRAVTLYCMQNNLFLGDAIDETRLLHEIDNVKVEFQLNPSTGMPHTYLNQIDVEEAIRTMEVSKKVSQVSAIPFVRKAMVALQQEMGKARGIVMDGRDIGTVVFPEAELKVFVTAKPEIRAKRRFDELQAKGNTTITFDDVLDNLKQRDFLDQTRAESPLKMADDAIELDNSYMTIEQQMQWLLHMFNQIITNK